jgi:FkbM family methyltransferase
LAAWPASFANGDLCRKTNEIYLIVSEANRLVMTDQVKAAILNKIPMTRVRLFIARILYFFVHLLLRNNIHRIRRKGIVYQVDLSEGVDLSLFLFGNFQDHVTNQKYVRLKDNAVIFDVGANIGGMAFRFAQQVPRGRVYAFEPTDFAFNKLLNNLSLNPHLAKVITPVQLFLSDRTASRHQIRAYASWKVDGSTTDAHRLHGGALKSARSVAAMTLDDYCATNGIDRVDLIKIDTDGHEFSVLKGARRTIEKNRPYIIFEIGLYVLQEQHIAFEQICDYFDEYDYQLINAKGGQRITLENFSYRIPERSTTDIVAVPAMRSETSQQ